MDTENTTPQEATSKSANDIPITIDVLPGDQLRAVRFGLSGYGKNAVERRDTYAQALDQLRKGEPFTAKDGITYDMLCEFTDPENVYKCEAREIARGEVLEHVPANLLNLLDGALYAVCGTLEPGVTLTLDEAQKQWVHDFYNRQLVQLLRDIDAVSALEDMIDVRLARRDRMLSAKGDGSG